MVRKPGEDWRHRDDHAVKAVQNATSLARGGVSVARGGAHVMIGLLCWFFALLWGWAALAGGLLAGSMPTFIGVGLMAAFMAWAGRRAFGKARGS